MTQESRRDRKNLLAVNLSLAANALLAVLKTVVGILSHSPALLADGINSIADTVYLLIVLIFMRLAGKPPDREHPYGHHQLDSIAAVIVGAFVITTAVAVFFNAIGNAFNLLTGRAELPAAGATALVVAVFTIVLKVVLAIYTRWIARRTGSITVLALARDHRNDIFSIAVATAGITCSRAGYVWVDPAAAAVVAIVIFYTGVEIVRDSSADLMNILPDRAVTRRIRQLLEVVPGVEQVEDVRIHRIGLYLLVTVTIGVDGSLTVTDGDRIASRAEASLWENVEYLRHVTVHYHPGRA